MNPYYAALSLWSALLAFIIIREAYIIRVYPIRKIMFFSVLTLFWLILLSIGSIDNQNKVIYILFFISLCCFIFFRLCIFCSMVAAIIVLVFTGIAEMTGFIVLHFFMGHTQETIIGNVFINSQLHIIMFFLVTLINRAIWRVRPNKLKCGKNHFERTPLILFFVFTLSLIYVNFYHIRYLSVGIKEAVYGAIFFLCLIFNFIFFYVYYQYKAKNEENKELRLYIKITARLTEELRSFKHNYFNLLYSLMGYIENGEWAKLEKYFRNVVAYSEKIDKNNLLSLQRIKNFSVVGLLAAKIKKAQDGGINFLVDISENEEYLAINNHEFLEILGIYLDNAIEAASESKKKCVAFGLGKIESSTYVIVKNTFDGEIPLFSSLSKKGFSTKGEDRGYGLWIVSEILKKHPEVLSNNSIKNEYFIQELIIPTAKGRSA